MLPPIAEVVTSRITVPVNVPFGRPVMSAVTMKSRPSGGKMPIDGTTVFSHGLLSSVAVKGSDWPGNPGMCKGIVIKPLLPAGALTLGFVGATIGARTTRTVTEYAVNAFAQGRNARTR